MLCVLGKFPLEHHEFSVNLIQFAILWRQFFNVQFLFSMRLWLLTVDEFCQDKVPRGKQCRLAVDSWTSLSFSRVARSHGLVHQSIVDILLNSSHCSSITVCHISTIVSPSFLSCPRWDLYCPLSFHENGSFHRFGHKNSPNQRVPVGVENVVSRLTTKRRLFRILDVGYPEIVWPILALDFLGLSCCSGFHALVEIAIRLPHLKARSCVFVCVSCYRFPDERLRASRCTRTRHCCRNFNCFGHNIHHWL